MIFIHLAPLLQRTVSFFPPPIYLAFSPNERLEILPPLLPTKHLRDVVRRPYLTDSNPGPMLGML